MTDRGLIQQALDALEKLNKDGWILADFEDEVYAAIKALRARLAQPEQKPVAWYYAGSNVEWPSVALDADLDDAQKANCTPLYTAPPQREFIELTDEEILEEYRQSYGDDGDLTDVYFARAIEAKLKEKNND